MATDNQILKIKFEESGLTNITAKVEDLNGALTRLGKSKTAVVSGLTKEQAKNIEGISNVRETTPDKVLKQGARATSEEFKYSQKEAEKSLIRHQRAVDQIESRKEKRFKHTLKEQRGLMHDWLKGFGGVGDMRHYTGVSYKQPTGVSLFNDLSQMHPAIGGGMFNTKRMKQLSSITPKSPDSYLQSTYAPKEIKSKIVQESEQKKIFKMIQAQEEFNKREKVGMWNSSFIAPPDQYPEKKGWRNLQSKLDLEYQQQINQEQTINKQGKKSIESRKKEIDGLKKTSNMFKSLSTATLMLNMSFLGVYFSFMGLFNVMRSGIMSIFAPISDIGGTITGSALATAFLGKDKATGMGGSDVADLISSWKTLSGVQGEITTLISKLATSIFTDSGFQSSLFSILDSIKTFVTNPKLKDAIIGLFSMLADNMPEILDVLIDVVNLTKTLVDFVSKNPMILKAVLYSIVAMPFLSILNLIAGGVSALISLITGYMAWNKSMQLALLAAQNAGTISGVGSAVLSGGLGGAITGGLSAGASGGIVGIASYLGMSVAGLVLSVLTGLFIGLAGVHWLVYFGIDDIIENIGGFINDFIRGNAILEGIRNAIVMLLTPITLIGGMIVGFFQGNGLSDPLSGISKAIENMLRAFDILVNAVVNNIQKINNFFIGAGNFFRSKIGWSQLDYSDFGTPSNMSGAWKDFVMSQSANQVTSTQQVPTSVYVTNISDGSFVNSKVVVNKNDQAYKYNNVTGH